MRQKRRAAFPSVANELAMSHEYIPSTPHTWITGSTLIKFGNGFSTIF